MNPTMLNEQEAICLGNVLYNMVNNHVLNEKEAICLNNTLFNGFKMVNNHMLKEQIAKCLEIIYVPNRPKMPCLNIIHLPIWSKGQHNYKLYWLKVQCLEIICILLKQKVKCHLYSFIFNWQNGKFFIEIVTKSLNNGCEFLVFAYKLFY